MLEATGIARITTGQSPFLESTTDENMFLLLGIDVIDRKLVICNQDETQFTVLLLTIHVPNLRSIELVVNCYESGNLL